MYIYIYIRYISLRRYFDKLCFTLGCLAECVALLTAFGTSFWRSPD